MSDQPDRRPGHPLYHPDEDESLAAMPEQADKPFDAQKAYDEATPIPISDERIDEIVKNVMQADTREAGSREVQSPATEGVENPLDQPVTGSASRSALQEAMSRSWGAVQSRHFAALVDEVVRFQKIEREQRVASEIRGERSKASQSAHHRKLAEAMLSGWEWIEDCTCESDPDSQCWYHMSDDEQHEARVQRLMRTLASEQVVDPEKYREMEDGFIALAKRCNESQDNLKRLDGKYWEQVKVANDAEQQLAALQADNLEFAETVMALNKRNVEMGDELAVMRSTGDSDE